MATWNQTFNVTPADSTNPSQGDDAIRELKMAIAERIKNEHETFETGYGTGTASGDWLHKSGSAKGYFQLAPPTQRPDSTSALTERDDGRLWIDEENYLIYVYDHSALTTGVSTNGWVCLNREIVRLSIQGPLYPSTSLLPPIILPHGGTLLKVSAKVYTPQTGQPLRIAFYKNASNCVHGSPDWLEIPAGGGAVVSSVDFDPVYKVLADDDYLSLVVIDNSPTTWAENLSVSIEMRMAG